MSTRIVTVFGASAGRPGDADYEGAVRCGRLLGEAGFAVATGGYGGLMEAVSAGAAEAGGAVIGVTAPDVFPGRSGANRHVTDERRAATLSERIHELIAVADATIALPGSIGTFTELAMAWNLAFAAQYAALPSKPVIAVGTRWHRLIGMLAAELDTDARVVTCVDDVDAAVAAVRRALA